MITELRENDIELYDKLYDTNLIHQNRIIGSYLELEYGSDNTLNESITALAAVAGLATLFGIIYRDRVSNHMFLFAKKMGDFFEKVGNFLVKHSQSMKFRYVIIQQNISKCYRACGVTEKDITMFHYLATKKDIKFGTVKSISQGDCLRNCYIDYTIETIALLTKSYFICLKKTGAFADVQNTKPDDLLTMLSGLKLSSRCKEYYDLMKDIFDNFYSLLDYIYEKDQSSKDAQLQRLKLKLVESKKYVENIKSI